MIDCQKKINLVKEKMKTPEVWLNEYAQMLRQILNLKTEFGGATGRNNKNNESRKKHLKVTHFIFMHLCPYPYFLLIS